MPYLTQDRGVYVTNGATTVTHGKPYLHTNGFTGISVKQKARSWRDGLVSPETIGSSEKFYLINKGTVDILTPTGATQGSALYITSSHVVTTASSGNTKFGRVVEVAGTRGVPTGHVRADLDTKDSF